MCSGSWRAARSTKVWGLETFDLICHPAHPAKTVTRLAARISMLNANWLTLRWKVEGAGKIVLPPFAGQARTDGLWQTTCFELFVKVPGGAGYAEFNLSPSERWAAYDFAGYREGMAERFVPRAPVCTPRRGGSALIFDAAIPGGHCRRCPGNTGLRR